MTKSISPLLTAIDLSALLQVSRRKLEEMVAAGEVPHPVRFGRIRRWHPDSIAQWLANQDAVVNRVSDPSIGQTRVPGRPRNEY